MINPYTQLYIYYLDGVVEIPHHVSTDPDFFGCWQDEEIIFLFFAKPSDDTVKQLVNDVSHNVRLIDTYEMTGEQWHGGEIEPYTMHDLFVCPPWNQPDPPGPHLKKVLLDPGVVFGTGRHQTTHDCLDLICRLCQKHTIHSMLDIGTGTGILSIGAAALNIRQVMACDFNHLAVKTCLNNIRINCFEDRILTFQAKGEEIMPIPCDLLVVNIHYDVMQHLIEDPAFLKKRFIILSGLLASETKKIVDTLSSKNIHIVERRCPDGIWNTLFLKND